MNVKLPSDGMTPGEWKKKNSAVAEYDLGKPMTWAELQALPYDLRKRYIEKLRDEYRATQIMVADMLGASVTTFRKRCTAWGIRFPMTGGRITPEAMAEWERFKSGTAAAPAPTTSATVAGPAETPAPAPAPGGLIPASGSLTFQGSAGAAMRQVYNILGETDCKVTISREAEE